MASARCFSICWRREAVAPTAASSSGGNVRRRRRRRAAQNVVQDVLAADDDARCAWDSWKPSARCLAEDAAALGGGQFDPAELRTLHALDAVVLRQPLIQEGVAGIEEIG